MSHPSEITRSKTASVDSEVGNDQRFRGAASSTVEQGTFNHRATSPDKISDSLAKTAGGSPATAAALQKSPGSVERRRARAAVHYAISIGRLRRPSHCRDCRERHPLEGHHYRGYDHANRLKVRWLCADCHTRAHGKSGAQHVWTITELKALPSTTDRLLA